MREFLKDKDTKELKNEESEEKEIFPDRSDFRINSYFTAIHRGEIFNLYPIGKLFEKYLIDEVNIFKDTDVVRSVEIKTYSDAIRYMNETKLNYLKHYKVYLSKALILNINSLIRML